MSLNLRSTPASRGWSKQYHICLHESLSGQQGPEHKRSSVASQRQHTFPTRPPEIYPSDRETYPETYCMTTESHSILCTSRPPMLTKCFSPVYLVPIPAQCMMQGCIGTQTCIRCLPLIRSLWCPKISTSWGIQHTLHKHGSWFPSKKMATYQEFKKDSTPHSTPQGAQ